VKSPVCGETDQLADGESGVAVAVPAPCWVALAGWLPVSAFGEAWSGSTDRQDGLVTGTDGTLSSCVDGCPAHAAGAATASNIDVAGWLTTKRVRPRLVLLRTTSPSVFTR